MTASIELFLQKNPYQFAPPHVDDVCIPGYQGVDSDSGPNKPDRVYPVPQYCRQAAQSIFQGISYSGIDRNKRAELYNNECISRVHPQGKHCGEINITDVFYSLYKNLNSPDVKAVMYGYTAYAVGQRYNCAGLDCHGNVVDRTLSDKAHQPSGRFQNSKRKLRLAELERSKPLLQGSTDFVFAPGSHVEQRLNDVIQITRPDNGNHSSYEPSAVVFELQKLAMLIAAAVPENTLRSSENFRPKLQEILTHDYQANDTWQDKHQVALELSSLYKHFQPLSYLM